MTQLLKESPIMNNKQISSLLVAGFFMSLPYICLATTSASTLVRQIGTTAGDQYGKAVVAGDINGDGYDDVISGTNAPTNYISITYGGSSLLSSTTISSGNSVIITSSTASDSFGGNIVTGDINNDGYDDIIVSAATDSTGGSGTGAIYIIYGKAASYTSTTTTADTSIVKIIGSVGDSASDLAIGDYDNDGYDDIAVGAQSFSTNTGGVYLIFGSSTVLSGQSNSLPATASAFYTGEGTNNFFGCSVALGDINGDGYADLVAGASGVGGSAGSAFLTYGSHSRPSGSISANTFVKFNGEVAGDSAGSTVYISNNSINTDIYNDLIVAAPNNGDTASGAGAVYVVPGSDTNYTAITSLGDTGYYEITGGTASDALGYTINAADLNYDGYSELVISSIKNNSSTGVV
ncbi:MAG: hypothetical protein ACD_43C00003G0001, partial [uncultured bacterium]